jgi:hypothetical protein
MGCVGNIRVVFSIELYAVDSIFHHCQRRAKVSIENIQPRGPSRKGNQVSIKRIDGIDYLLLLRKKKSV